MINKYPYSDQSEIDSQIFEVQIVGTNIINT